MSVLSLERWSSWLSLTHSAILLADVPGPELSTPLAAHLSSPDKPAAAGLNSGPGLVHRDLSSHQSNLGNFKKSAKFKTNGKVACNT